MRYVPPPRWKFALGGYLATGLVAGLVVSDLGPLLTRSGINAKFAIAAVVNLVLPASVVLVTAWYPRVRTACAGAVLVTLGFVVGELLRSDWHFWAWPLNFALKLAHPMLVAGTVVECVIGSAVALAVARFRRVGVPEDPSLCKGCGYSLVGLEERLCPECGVRAPG